MLAVVAGMNKTRTDFLSTLLVLVWLRYETCMIWPCESAAQSMFTLYSRYFVVAQCSTLYCCTCIIRRDGHGLLVHTYCCTRTSTVRQHHCYKRNLPLLLPAISFNTPIPL